VGRGVATLTGGVEFTGTVGIVVSVAANVGEGAGVVGVGERLPGGVLVGFAADVIADSKCEVFACAFAIPSTAPIQENKRSEREHAATRAREAVDLLSLERTAKWMAWLLNRPYPGIPEVSDGA
jgi:hypothetical protein